MPLREFIVEQMARYGIVASVDNVMITSGSQQALDLIAKLLINRGDRILVESPTYLGALQAFDLMGAEYVTVPIDDHGLNTDYLEAALRSGPKFMYILPNFQNPGGVTLSEDRRKSWCCCPTSTASRSSKTIPTASFATKASTRRRWWCSTAPTCSATTATPWATSST